MISEVVININRVARTKIILNSEIRNAGVVKAAENTHTHTHTHTHAHTHTHTYSEQVGLCSLLMRE